MESISKTCKRALKNIVTGVTHFNFPKTDVRGPRYALLSTAAVLLQKIYVKAAGGGEEKRFVLMDALGPSPAAHASGAASAKNSYRVLQGYISYNGV